MFLSSALLKAYIDTFNGYGDYRAKYWFVGMEEGGGGSFDEVSRRLTRWDASGQPELLDLAEHHREGDLTSFVSDSDEAGLQPTWKQLIRIVLGGEGQPTDNKAVRTYQQNRLGRYGGETCLLELMPLPSPDAKVWHYRDWSLLPDLRSRSGYVKKYAPIRALRLRELIDEQKPPVVVFYSFTYMVWWKQVANVELTPTEIRGVKSFLGENEHTRFIVVSQPAHRMKCKGSDYYVQVGKEIAMLIRSL